MEPDGLDYGYDSYLEKVPDALRSQIEPMFKDYQENIKSKVSERYSGLDPFKELTDAGWQPEHVNAGLQVLQMVNDPNQHSQIIDGLLRENPQLEQQIRAKFQVQQQQPQFGNNLQQFQPNSNLGQNQNNNDLDGMNLPPQLLERMNQQEQLINLMFQGFQQQQQQAQQWQTQQQEQAELAELKKMLDQVAPENKYPRQFILSYLSQGQTPQEAVKSYESWYQQQIQKQNNAGAPLIAPANGGGLPSERIDTSKLKDPDRKNLMVQLLEAANQQG